MAARLEGLQRTFPDRSRRETRGFFISSAGRPGSDFAKETPGEVRTFLSRKCSDRERNPARPPTAVVARRKANASVCMLMSSCSDIHDHFSGVECAAARRFLAVILRGPRKRGPSDGRWTMAADDSRWAVSRPVVKEQVLRDDVSPS